MEVKSKIQNLIKKREYDYNHQCYHSIKLHQDIVCYNNNKKPNIINDKGKILEMDKYYYENKHKHLFIKIDDVYVYDNAYEYIIYYYEFIRPEIQQMMQKLIIKDVDMMALINDLNAQNINVNALLMEMHKHEGNVDHMTSYLQKNNIEITNLMSILYRNHVTVGNLLQNQYIYNLIKKSPYASLFLTMAPSTISTKEVVVKIPTKKLLKKVHVYAIYKIKNEEIINLNINYNHLAN